MWYDAAWLVPVVTIIQKIWKSANRHEVEKWIESKKERNERTISIEILMFVSWMFILLSCCSFDPRHNNPIYINVIISICFVLFLFYGSLDLFISYHKLKGRKISGIIRLYDNHRIAGSLAQIVIFTGLVLIATWLSASYLSAAYNTGYKANYFNWVAKINEMVASGIKGKADTSQIKNIGIVIIWTPILIFSFSYWSLRMFISEAVNRIREKCRKLIHLKVEYEDGTLSEDYIFLSDADNYLIVKTMDDNKMLIMKDKIKTIRIAKGKALGSLLTKI